MAKRPTQDIKNSASRSKKTKKRLEAKAVRNATRKTGNKKRSSTAKKAKKK